MSDTGNHRVLVFDAGGKYIRTIGAPSTNFVNQDTASATATTTGNVTADAPGEHGHITAADGTFFRPLGVAADNQERIYVCDCGNDRIQIFSLLGEHLSSSEVSFEKPTGICVDSFGNALICYSRGVAVFSGCPGVRLSDADE